MHHVPFMRRILLVLCAIAPLGCCCERKGYILRGDFALELNRVSHLLGRYDDYEMCAGDCDCAVCSSGWGDGGAGETLGSPEPRLHPVPTRPVFAPQRTSPTPATRPAEEVSPPFEESTVPTGQRRQRYGSTTPRGARPLLAAQASGLQLNAADRPTRRRTLAPVATTTKTTRR